MNRKVALLVIFLAIKQNAFCEEVIAGIPENIIDIPVGNGTLEVDYLFSGEDILSPGSPMVGSDGGLFFHRQTSGQLLFVRNNRLSSLPYESDFEDLRRYGGRFRSSFGGFYTDGWALLAFSRGKLYEYYYTRKNVDLEGPGYKIYPTPFGAILYSEQEKSGIAIVFDIANPSREFHVIEQDRLRSWLKTQPGEFRVGDDGWLYRNGILWSALPPKDWDGARFMGKLASGHNIWGVGTLGMESWFLITNSRSEIELTFFLPWKYDGQTEIDLVYFNYGFGPVGEVYALLAPPLITRNEESVENREPPVKFDKTVAAKLVVVRNHLEYFGRLSDNGVRLRKDPSTDSQIIGTYPVGTGFRLLEKGLKEESIGGQNSVWFKVRLLDGTEGWFFGAFVRDLYNGPNQRIPPWPNIPNL